MLSLSLLIGPLTTLIERIFPDKAKQDEAKAEMMTIMQEAQAKELEAKSAVVIAEAKGDSWLQRNWRPISMMVFLAVIINNYILVPYLQAFGVAIPALDIAPQMWTLLTIGIGGYIAGRSGEKIVKDYSKQKFYDALRKEQGVVTAENVKFFDKILDSSK